MTDDERVVGTTPDPLLDADGDVDTLRREVLRLRDELIGAEAELGNLRAEVTLLTERQRLQQERQVVSDLDHMMAMNASLERQLVDTRGSTTWRLGRMFVRPLYSLRRRLGAADST